MQDPVYSGFCHSTNHDDAGNSFVALLYSPPSLLQCDFQEISDRKLCVVDSMEGGTFATSSQGIITEHLNNHVTQSRPHAIPDICSRAMVGLSSSSHSVFQDTQCSNIAGQSAFPAAGKAREPFSYKSQWCGTSHASTLNVCGSDIQMMPNMVAEQCSYKHNSLSLSGCPRVFCMEKSGYLLLSNTGLLGVVCSCHCLHMSVLKFCEHSGLHGINPGGAVHMESGETIAQWKKLYFSKLGIRSPGNESEWDWPEALSTTGSLMKSNASTSNISKTDLNHIFSSSAVMLRKQLATIQEGCNIPLKGFTGISQNNLYDRVKSQMKDSILATCTTAPNFVGTQLNDGCQPPTPPFLDSLKRNDNLSAHSPTQTRTSLLKDQERFKNSHAKDVHVGQDATSSNIELRLGQPPQTGNPVPSFVEPPLSNAHVRLPKLHPLKQMVNMHVREEQSLNNLCHASGSLKMIEELPQLKFRKYISGVSYGLCGARSRSETENEAWVLPFSPLPQSNSQCEMKTKASEIFVNDFEPIMSKKQHSEFSSMQVGPTNVLWNNNGHIGRQVNSSATGSIVVLDNGKGVSFAKDSHAKLHSGFGIGKLVEYPSSITGAVGGSDTCISIVNGKIGESHNESSMSSDPSGDTNFLCGSKNMSSCGQNNHLTSGMPIPFERILKCSPLNDSSSKSNQVPTLLQQQGINMETPLLDENMRFLALTQILELSKQQHALHSDEMSQMQGRSNYNTEFQLSECESPTSEQFSSGTTLKLPKNRGTCGNPDTTDDLEKLGSLTGSNRYCLSALAPIPLHSNEKESHCKHAYDLRNEEPSLSLGIDKDNTRSSACENCTEKPLDINLVGKYSCAAQVNCCRSNFFSGIGPSCYTYKQQFANGGGETSLKIPSKFGKDQHASKDESISFEQGGGKLDGQDSIKIGSRIHQWRDVPRIVRKADCDATSLDLSATVLDWEGLDGQPVNNYAKVLKGTIDMEESLKEQESSNVSSGCSVPVVTQASVEFSMVDSCTMDAVDTGYADNLVVDEGSGVDKGWSPNLSKGERSAEFPGSTCKSYLNKGYLKVLNGQQCRSLLDELKLLDSLTWKKGQDRSHIMLSGNCIANPSQKPREDLEEKKRKRTKMRSLDTSLSSKTPSLLHLHNKNGDTAGVINFPSCFSKEMLTYFSSGQHKSSTTASSFHHNTKQKQTAFSSKVLSFRNSLSKHHSDKGNYVSESNSDEVHPLPEVSGRKKVRADFASDCHFQMQKLACKEHEKANPKLLSSRTNGYSITRPIVCGEYGEICSGNLAGEVQKPAKIVSLSKILKTPENHVVPINGKPRITSKRKWKRLNIGTSSGRCYGKPASKTKDSETQNTTCNDTNVNVHMEDLERGKKPLSICKGKKDAKAKQGDSIINRTDAPSELKSKEIWKQLSIYDLTDKETEVKDILGYAEDRQRGLCNTRSRNFVQEHISLLNSDAVCSVCSDSSGDDFNCLLECSRCLIRVHQACYGISTLPKKGRWSCRPCQTNSKDIACVLCGYGGGAMTRAIQSRPIVKSLLKEWSIERDGMAENRTSHKVFKRKIDALGSSKSGLEVDQTCDLMPENASRSDLLKVEMPTNRMQHAPQSVGNFRVRNSITAGVHDASVKQWVHMVCGLWTPGTRCPNVHTMNAFDVSGVTCPRVDVVCSICKRWGGSCIECRVVDCSVKFHPWCAHQKKLLQCETEGADDEKVGFYGRCVLHAIDPRFQSKYNDPIDEMSRLEEKEFTCARTEGYKGRKRDGFQNNCYSALKANGGCHVPEEQINAWVHINGQKLCSLGLPKPASDIEHDCRKEYVRYKQAKGWKHLVVYKSGIHALGLYTSRFIYRGEMVVEYVGEIVGPRVADKREIEYQSGRKVQYKSACYFFRIDKEHIIDATRKGGIARFVNHSCLPNCVAKVITIRHEKKVVFFAERDIYPGEEITYDYHFNNEDEGKKIPCYCNSKNCRRYLN